MCSRCAEAGGAPNEFDFPPADLLPALMDAYFDYMNVTAPLLHRPTFARAIAAGAHHTDTGVGALLLLVCAIGARFVDDPRVFIDGAPSRSCGWKWFNQVKIYRRSLLAPPNLQDLQMICVRTPTARGAHADSSAYTAVSHVSPGLICTAVVLEPCRHRDPSSAGHRCAPEEDI
jgi:hypothetical protein